MIFFLPKYQRDFVRKSERNEEHIQTAKRHTFGLNASTRAPKTIFNLSIFRRPEVIAKMPVAAMISTAVSTPAVRKSSLAPEKKYKCQFCNRAFSRSEHRSRHERSRKFMSSLAHQALDRQTIPELTIFNRHEGAAI